MSRIQVLFLPAPADEYPFVIVIDQVDDPGKFGDLAGLRDQIGAKAVLVFEDMVEVAS